MVIRHFFVQSKKNILCSVEFKKSSLELLLHSHLIRRESFHLSVFWRDFFSSSQVMNFLVKNGYKLILGKIVS